MQSRRDLSGAKLCLLLASSSVALLIGSGTPPAYAACSTSPTNSGTVSGICINNTTVPAVTNSGHVTRTGVSIQNSTVTGNITNTGTGTITADGGGNAPTFTGIYISGGSIAGAISNAGTITATSHGIVINGHATVSGGITNSGTISVTGGIGSNAINISSNAVIGSASAGGGIVNNGTIAGSNFGINISGAKALYGGITNSGAILGEIVGPGGSAIVVSLISTFFRAASPTPA